MTPEEFVLAFRKEKEQIIDAYLLKSEVTTVGKLISDLKLNPRQMQVLEKILDLSLTDCLYTILLGLDGAASIGGCQEDYKILDENGNELTGGEIESNAWKYFRENI